MHDTEHKMMSFESEYSLGTTGDAVFIDIRHRILTGQYAPGRLLQPEQFAKAATIPKSFAVEVCEALVDHGYLVVDPARTFRIICWTSAQFKDLVEACHDLIGLAIDKCMTRIDAAGIYACNP